ncbi:FadR/GntR family transcriptional regulator [Sinorhizobium americanum]|uniref:GntR family transcriptional repressor for pyruvate dehydrogenase complex n=1 Tax=Sinorhizobium americanum TaxID=194963 RepID=A0A4R2B7W7_9HYPH|nr:FadR/GntR family transcriptional regulator [Sinorhizobium americanum]TCN22818.1 GntR family transcriptional repressor for pyruvate dehydrogenase complex [Sinorhizobium americanum]
MNVPHEERGKLSERVYDRLRQKIDGGEWPQGTRIPTESELAASFNVSRPVVREALVQLRTEGAIDSRRGSGSIVISAREIPKRSYEPIENVADLISAFEFRLTIECDAAASAALRAKPQDLAEIVAAHERFSSELSDEEFGDCDLAFHVAIAKATGNKLFEATLSMLHHQILFGMRLTGEFSLRGGGTRAQTVYREHAAVVEAIRGRDAQGAFEAMRDHLLQSRHRILGFDVPSDWRRAAPIGTSLAVPL